MLKANVGLSRKITRDYNSTGYSVNIEGEISAPLDDPQAVVARVHELFHLAEEALGVEIDRDQSEDAIGRRDEEPVKRQPVETPPAPTRPAAPVTPPPPQKPTNGTPRSSSNDTATSKQVQFIENLAKRQKLSFTQLGSVVQQIVGQSKSLQQLTKKEAGSVIDSLNGNGNGQH